MILVCSHIVIQFQRVLVYIRYFTFTEEIFSLLSSFAAECYHYHVSYMIHDIKGLLACVLVVVD